MYLDFIELYWVHNFSVMSGGMSIHKKVLRAARKMLANDKDRL